LISGFPASNFLRLALASHRAVKATKSASEERIIIIYRIPVRMEGASVVVYRGKGF
jgi:hypothetical protein